jgi:hypothetical protein
MTPKFDDHLSQVLLAAVCRGYFEYEAGIALAFMPRPHDGVDDRSGFEQEQRT